MADTGLCIMTNRGWKRIGGPLAPTPPQPVWWFFPGHGHWEALFGKLR